MSDLGKRMIKVIIIIMALACIVGALYYRGKLNWNFISGVMLGGSSSILKVFMLDQAVKRAVKEKTIINVNFFTIQSILRLLVSAIVLLAAALLNYFDLLATAIGVLAFNIATYFIRAKEKPAKTPELS